MRRGFVLLVFSLLAGCAGNSTNPDGAFPIPLTSAETSPALVPVPEKLENTKLQGAFDLKEAISEWISLKHPHSYEEVVKQANSFIRKNGFPLQLDASRVLKKNPTRVEIQSGKKLFTFKPGRELSEKPDICGEHFLNIPVILLPENNAALVSAGKKYPFSLKKFRLEKVRIFREKKIVSTIAMPEATEPLGISRNGKAVYLKFPLEEPMTLEWWTRVVKNMPMVIGEDPYLVLKVEKEKISFDADINKLNPQEFEVQDSSPEALRWRYLPSNLILELSSHCGK